MSKPTHKEQMPAIFEDFKIRRQYDETTEKWLFSVVDIIAALTQQPDHQTARKYWNKLKERLKKEGSESVTHCHRLKLTAADGKAYLTDVADPETIFRIVQSVPSPKAEPSSFGWPGWVTSAFRTWVTRPALWIAPVTTGNSMAAAKSGFSSG